MIKNIQESSSSYQEFIFKDAESKHHSCQYIQLPNFNLLVQDKVKPLPSMYSTKVLHALNIAMFERKIKSWKNEIDNYEDFYDEEPLTRMAFEVRLYTEKLLKFLLVNLIKGNSKKIEILSYDIEKIQKNYIDLLDKYPDRMLGQLKKWLKKANVNVNIPQGFINKLNEFSHETGNIPKVRDVSNLIKEFSCIEKEVFDLIEKVQNIK